MFRSRSVIPRGQRVDAGGKSKVLQCRNQPNACFNSCKEINSMPVANLQDAFATEFEIDTAQNLYKVKTAVPCFQATFVHTRE